VRAPRLLVLGVVAAVVLATASIAMATFASSSSAGPLAVSSATLSVPGGVSAAASTCIKNVPTRIVLAWTVSNFATGYRIYRSSASTFALLATVGSGITSYTDNATAYSTTFSYYVVATFQSWTAQSSTASATTLSAGCK
jgi:hypothetical protein